MRSTSIVLEQFKEEIQTARYREATKTFSRLVADEGQPLRQPIQTAISAAAPFIQVPSHLMMQPSGDMRGVNYDHTILGWRAAVALMKTMPQELGILPCIQAMWYVPQGLNIWEQISCEFPGHYARAERCNQRFPGPDKDVDRFDGPAWEPAKIDFEDSEPIGSGSADDRFDRFGWAVTEGDRRESYGLFLSLAQDPTSRDRLREQLLFYGIIDLQGELINRGLYQNIGHKALRARALIDLADYLGWDQAREVMYTVVPDLGCSPRLYGLWHEVSALVSMDLRRGQSIAKRARSADDRELNSLTDAILWGGPYEVNETVLAMYRAGCGILDVADAVVVSYQQYLIDTIENPHAFNYPMHAFDYCNVVNTWIRDYDNPHQIKGPIMAARFVNDAIRYNAMFPRDPMMELEPRSTFRGWADSIARGDILRALEESILAQDAPRACALVDSYLARTAGRRELLETITYAGCHFQNDPHITRNCASSLEEFRHNQTSRRDDIIRGFVKHQARYVKRSQSFDAFAVYAGKFTNGRA